MKINNLVLHGFSSHTNSTIVFGRQVSIVVGQLNAGKSSIASAVEYALAGECSYYRKQNDNRSELIHDLTDMGAMIVSLEMDKGLVRRSRNNDNVESLDWNGATVKPAVLESAITSALGVGAEIISTALNTSDFFSLEAKIQKEMIIRLIGAEVTDAKVKALFTGEPEAWKLLTGAITSLQSLENAYKYVFERRTIVKRDKNDLKPPNAPEGAAPPIDKIQALLKQVETELQQAIADKARFEGAAAAVDAKKNQEARLTALQQTPAGPLPEEVERLKKNLVAAQKVQTDASKAARASQEEYTAIREQIAVKEAEVKRLAEFTGKCVFADTDCSASATDMSSAKQVIANQIHLLMGRLEEAATQRDKHAVLRDSFGDIRKAEASLTAAQGQMEAGAKARKEIPEIEASIAKLAAVSADPAKIAELDTKIATVRERLEVGKKKLADGQSWLERDRQVKAVAEKRKAIEIELRHLEALCEFLGPKGVKVQLIDERIGTFEKAINQHLIAFGFEMKIEVEPWRIVARGRPLNRLSASERYRLGVAFQIGIAKMTGLNFVICDGTEILPAVDFGAMIGMLLKSGLDQAIVIRTLQVPEATFLKDKPAHPSIDYFVVRNSAGVSAVEKVS